MPTCDAEFTEKALEEVPRPVPALTPLERAVTVHDAVVVDAETQVVAPGHKRVDAVALAQVQSLADGISDGKTPQQAARDAGVALHELVKDPAVKKLVEALLHRAHLPAVVRRAVVRATVNDIMLTDPDPKVKLQAARQAAEDPEVGLSGKTPAFQVAMQFNEGATLALNTARGTKIPGLDEEEPKDDERS